MATGGIPPQLLVAQLKDEIAKMESRLSICERSHQRILTARRELRQEPPTGEGMHSVDPDTIPFKSGVSAIPAVVAALDAVLFAQELATYGNLEELRTTLPKAKDALAQAISPIRRV